jgi:hypothetical protein
MSAAVQLPMLGAINRTKPVFDADQRKEADGAVLAAAAEASAPGKNEQNTRVAFYRRHTERILRRYLYASMQVGRAPSALGESVGRGWVSSRPVRTFEDSVIFVLDVEACLSRIGALERELLFRIAIQEYTQAETAVMLGMSVRAVCMKFPEALDQLTEKLLESGVLMASC